MMQIPLLLTATVHPRGMRGASFSPEERAKQYAEALNFYVSELSRHPNAGMGWQIVLAENSGIEPAWIMDRVGQVDGVQIEYLNLGTEGSVQERGKGYNECMLIHRAIRQSRYIRDAGCFFKLTGRLQVKNIHALLSECIRRKTQAGELHFLADCKDHCLYERLHLPINGHAGECRYWFAETQFFEQEFMPYVTQLDDFASPPFLAEDLMLQVCRVTRGRPGCYDRFRIQARISGRGGHVLGEGWSFFYSTDNDTLVLRFKSALRQCLRWLCPWWRV